MFSVQDGERFTLSPSPSEEWAMPESRTVHKLAVYNVAEHMATSRILNIAAIYNARMEYGGTTSPPIYAHKYITGRSSFVSFDSIAKQQQRDIFVYNCQLYSLQNNSKGISFSDLYIVSPQTRVELVGLCPSVCCVIC